MVKITDEDSLEKWLKDRPDEDAVFITSRVAARVFPIYWDHALSPSSRQRHLRCVPFLRSFMSSSLAAKVPSDKIKAADAARAAARASFDDAAASATFVAAATRAADPIWSSVEKDATFLVNGGGATWPKLWVEADSPFDREWQRIKAQLSGQEGWGFWLDWYQRILDGGSFPEEYLNLLKDIATRDEAFWDGDDAAVNGRIAAVWEEYRDKFESSSGTTDSNTVAFANKTLVPTIRANQKLIEPSLETIQFLIVNEVKRLQEKNYRDQDDAEECKHQIKLLLTLLTQVEGMAKLVPEAVLNPDVVEDKAPTLLQEMAETARAAVKDCALKAADFGPRLAIVSPIALTLTACGVPHLAAWLIPGMTFLGAQAKDQVMALKDSIIKASES